MVDMPNAVFRTISLPPQGTPSRPLADVVFYILLRDHPALDALNLTLDLAFEASARNTPFLRLGVVRYREAGRPGESTPVCSLDVYADDHLQAEEIAATIARVWPFMKKVEIPNEGYISGAWVEVEPYRLEEPDEAEDSDVPARYHLEVGLRLHPSLTPSGA